jgi:hypothetical protein
MDEWDDEFRVLLTRFLTVLGCAGGAQLFLSSRHLAKIHLIEGDEDEDFTYGALVAALAQIGETEHDWLLVREFGKFYSLRHTDFVNLTEDE